MAVHSEPLEGRVTIEWHRVAAVIAWLIGVLFTKLLVSSVVAEPGYVCWTVAVLVQFLLTIAERPLWKWVLKRPGGRLIGLGIVITLLDGAINAGGIYPYIPRLSTSAIGEMLIHTFHLDPEIGTSATAFLSLTFGTLTAGLPEYLWESE